MDKNTEETILLARVKSPETKARAVAAIIDMYQEPLYWHIRKMVISHDDARDILQEVFLRTWEKIDSFRGDSKLFSWLFRIAINETSRFLDRKNRLSMNNSSLQEVLIQELESADLISGDEIQMKLQRAIIELPRKQQQVFNMRYFDEMSYEDIAEILKTSENSAKVSYHHAKSKIEEILKEEIL